jgi:7,8-dihydropterin-6-yl-methyl-4-(beta-D-ribofuranosyl)aminobenzene 5'-phosphate synthase
MGIRVSILSENVAGAGRTLAEFGWSVLIETDGQKILLDTGASISACLNARSMGIELNQVDKIVLSHSHFDHSGGLREVLLSMGRKAVDIIAHPHIWAMRYNRHEDKDVFMGLPFQRQELENLGACFNLVTRPFKLSENAMTSGEIAMTTEFEDTSVPAFGGLSRYMIENSEIKEDTLLDDLAVIVNTEAGLVVVLGCAHRGIINTLYHARNITGVERIYAVIGGAHLISESSKRVEKTIAALKELDVQQMGLCHCTGLNTIARMAQEFGKRFFFCNAGTVHELP